MKRMKIVFVAVAVSLWAMSCSSSKAMPTAAQKAQLKEVADSAGKAAKAVPAKSQTPAAAIIEVAKVQDIPSAKAFFRAITKSFSKVDSQVDVDEMQAVLQEALEQEECTLTLPPAEQLPSNGVTNPFGNLNGQSIKFNGDLCPVSLEISLSGSGFGGGGSSGALAMTLNYSVNDNTKGIAYRKLNDVDAITLSMDMSASSNGNGGTMKMTAESRVRSQKYGTLVERGSGTMQGSGGKIEIETVTTDTFSDFSVERKMHVDVSGDSQHAIYYVNGNEVSKDEYMSYSDQLAIGAGDTGHDD